MVRPILACRCGAGPKRLALAVAFTIFSGPLAIAADKVVVRLGMSLAEIEPYLREACTELQLNGNSEKYVTCWLKDGMLITATLTKKDRVVYSVFRQPGTRREIPDFASSIAAELGYPGEAQSCMVNSDDSWCWTKGTAEFWVYKEPDSTGRMSSFQRDEAMDAADR